MSIKKEYDINIDIKREFTDDSIYFRQNEGGSIVFNIFDNGKEMNISAATRAQVRIITPSKVSFVIECEFVTVGNKRKVKCVVDEVKVVESGIYRIVLTIQQNRVKVSTIPFNFKVYGDMNCGNTSYAELIGDLSNIFNDLLINLSDVVHVDEKGVPDGVATLDENGLIPMSQLPSDLLDFESHIQMTVYRDQVHKQRINSDGIWQYLDSDNTWKNAGYNIIRDGV